MRALALIGILLSACDNSVTLTGAVVPDASIDAPTGLAPDATIDAACDGAVNASCDPGCPSLAVAGVGIHPCTLLGKHCNYEMACLVCGGDVDGGSVVHWHYYDEACSKLGL